ncbi:MAG: hypothetical protein D6743_11615 [Calditrichaeota bacterium]|nr:MAG: hypothetical protein D6743_11615 [Calditrichota bacterium]
MNTDFLFFCLMGGIVSADTESVGQTMVSQPIVACTAAGALFGNLPLGATVGLLLQLPYLVELPVGGGRVSLGNLGAFVAAGVAAQAHSTFTAYPNAVLLGSVFWGILLSWIGAPLVSVTRTLNLRLLRLADAAAERCDLKMLTRLQYAGAFIALVFGALFSAAGLVVGTFLISRLLQFAPGFLDWLEAVSHLVKPVLLGAGAGAILWLYVTKSTRRYAALGAAAGLLLVWLI